jgi:hypothetical protein
LIPGSLINILPKWSKTIFLEQTLWKWMAFLFVLGIGYFFNSNQRKINQSRIDAPGAWHHIVACGIGRRKIFNDESRIFR